MSVIAPHQSLSDPADFDDPTPGIDVVSTHDDDGIAELLEDPHTRRVLGVMHRRFWAKRRDMLVRRAELGSVTTADEPVADAAPGVLAIRGWATTERTVLVDGRAVPGPVFDLALAIAHDLDGLRAGSTLAIAAPDVRAAHEARLWNDLCALAEDRFGLDRHTVRVVGELAAPAVADADEQARIAQVFAGRGL